MTGVQTCALPIYLLVVRGIDPLTDGAPVKLGSTLTLEQASAPVDAGVGPATPPVSSGSGDTPGSGSGRRHRAKDAP